MPPLVSVIVPNYNHKAYLQQRLDSIFNQSFTNFEVILLDDASTDGSTDLLHRYKNHPQVSQYVVNEKNSGSPFRQWQRGIALAKGEYIWIAESDDYCSPDFLKTLMERANDETGLYYAQTIDVNEKGEELLHRVVYTQEFDPNIWEGDFTLSGNEFITYLLVKNVIPNASGVIFKRDLVTADTFSPDLLQMRMCGDWFFWAKLCTQTRVEFVNKPLNYFRDHQKTSRNHHSLEKKKRRIAEEGIIREYIYRKAKLRNRIKEDQNKRKWFSYHSYKECFTPEFYAFKLPGKNNLSFFLNFLLYKLNQQ